MTIKHITTALTNEEIELILDYIEAKDALMEIINSGVKGWLATPEGKAEMKAQDKLWQYVERTGRAINATVGLYVGNAWD